MAKKKDFSLGGATAAPVLVANSDGSGITFTPVATLSIPLPDGRVTEVDYRTFLGQGFDDNISAVTQALRIMVAQGKPEPYSIRSTALNAIVTWFRFCTELARQGEPPTLKSIGRDTMEAYAGWLSTRLKSNGEVTSKSTARTAFTKTKTVLKSLVERKLLVAQGLFPRNLFPGSTHPRNRRNYIQPLSDTERERILRPLSIEVAQVFDGTHPGGDTCQLGLCVFAIFLKTGVNATPLLELSRDLSESFLDHPLVNRKVMVMFKRRAGAYTQTPLEPSKTKVVSLDVFKLCQRVLLLTEASALAVSGSPLADKLWICKIGGDIRGLSTQTLSSVADSFSKRHDLRRDDGTRLKMTSQLFRNTKINRVWRASKGNLLATAKSVSNTPRSAERYLAVTPHMLDEHRIAGEVLVETLTGMQTRQATPHSGCNDALNGDLAPKNGQPCVDFLSCFRCKSQVIIQEDLYKLFSFYWALFAQRTLIGSDNWKKLFSWIVRIIDRDIAPKFDAKVVAREKLRARTDPHPMWRSPAVLEALRSIV